MHFKKESHDGDVHVKLPLMSKRFSNLTVENIDMCNDDLGGVITPPD